MILDTPGQRCISEPEPELGLGIVAHVENYRILVDFPAVGEHRLYARGTPTIKRVQFREGESITTVDGRELKIEAVDTVDGLFVYTGGSVSVREDQISGMANLTAPQDRFMQGQVDTSDVFGLRYRSLEARSAYKKSELRGFLGGKVDLIPHQLFIVHDIAAREHPRVLLADEVGLGKTIEACLIIQRLLTTGKASRILILVPESLVNQWFVELLRRFNRWFSLFDEARCRELEHHDVDGNPFLDESLVICGLDYLASSEVRSKQAVEAGWDLVVIDEAHHLEWSPSETTPEYSLAEALSTASPGLLLLTATPTQFGLEGHFARLRLLDPARYSDYEQFKQEAGHYREIADIAAKLIEQIKLPDSDWRYLNQCFKDDGDRLERLKEKYTTAPNDATQTLLNILIDEYGTGRAVFRNTRDVIKGFPPRVAHLIPLASGSEGTTGIRQAWKEWDALLHDTESAIRYSFQSDARILWLCDFLLKNSDSKVLLICSTQRKAAAIKLALESTAIKFGVFHEGIPLIQRDRTAAWFAEPDGAQLLICSEIGSEGRNFQFAHHLVLFDLPPQPGLIEQRIGRLDRIGQTHAIHVHVPFLKDTCQELVAKWYHEGLQSFENSIKGAESYEADIIPELKKISLSVKTRKLTKAGEAAFESLLRRTVQFREKLEIQLQDGRDRLLELHSFNESIARKVVKDIETAESNPQIQSLLLDLLEHIGVDVTEFEHSELFLNPQHSFLEAFPSIKSEGILATFDRKRAVSREDITFLSEDHPIYQDALEVLLGSQAGSTAFVSLPDEQSNLLIECVFVLEPVCEARWHVDQFLSASPIRTVVDVRGRNRSEDFTFERIQTEARDGEVRQFLDLPVFNLDILKNLIAGAKRIAQRRATKISAEALQCCDDTLEFEHSRLCALKKQGHAVQESELEAMQLRKKKVGDAIQGARLRLDSFRIVTTNSSAV